MNNKDNKQEYKLIRLTCISLAQIIVPITCTNLWFIPNQITTHAQFFLIDQISIFARSQTIISYLSPPPSLNSSIFYPHHLQLVRGFIKLVITHHIDSFIFNLSLGAILVYLHLFLMFYQTLSLSNLSHYTSKLTRNS